jgi:CRISPR/Cas system-associated protein endoribonuclease Cas2
MGKPAFDTYSSVQILVRAGIQEKQASAIVRLVDQKMSQIVTNERLDFALEKQGLVLRQEITELKQEMTQMESRLFSRMTIMTGIIVAVLTALKFVS